MIAIVSALCGLSFETVVCCVFDRGSRSLLLYFLCHSILKINK